MSLLGQPFSLHDVENVENLLRQTMHRTLRANGGVFDQHDYDDALSYLLVLAWRLSEHFEPAPGRSFSTYLSQVASMRLADWYRRRKGSARNKFRPELVPFDLLDVDTPDPDEFEEGVLSALVTAA